MRSVWLVALIAGCGFTPSGLAGDGDAAAIDAPAIDAPVPSDGRDPIDARPDAAIDAAPLACPGDYTVLGTGTYRRVNTASTWEAARADCADDDDGGTTGRTHLVVIGGEIERAGVRAVFAGPKLWIGLSDRVTTGTWQWVTLEPIVGYPPPSGTPWKGGQPNDGGGGTEDCVVMEADGDWDDRPCDNDTEAYVCECDAFAEAPAQSDP